MKIYSIFITIIAVLAVAAAGYFYWQYQGIARQRDFCLKEKAQTENKLSQARALLGEISKTSAVLKASSESFMIPGDLKAQTVGSKEAVDVEQKIGEIMDKTDRMMAEKNWSDFKSSLRLNSLFGLLRNLAGNLERILERGRENSHGLEVVK